MKHVYIHNYTDMIFGTTCSSDHLSGETCYAVHKGRSPKTSFSVIIIDEVTWCLAAGNPASVASPATGSRLTAGAAASTDEQAYLDKWKQLQKYIEPLKRMINKINKDEGTC